RLPSAYIQRMVEELTDHAADLSLEDLSMEAQQNIEGRLGTPEQIAAAAKAEFNCRTFAGRHPLFTFVVGPLLTTFIIYVATVLLVIGACFLLDFMSSGLLSANDDANLPPSAFEFRLMQFMSGLVRFVPFVLSAWLFVQLGRRSRRYHWSIAACSIIV